MLTYADKLKQHTVDLTMIYGSETEMQGNHYSIACVIFTPLSIPYLIFSASLQLKNQSQSCLAEGKRKRNSDTTHRHTHTFAAPDVEFVIDFICHCVYVCVPECELVLCVHISTGLWGIMALPLSGSLSNGALPTSQLCY